MNMDRQQMTDHDLLIRIDERTENMEQRQDNHAGRLRTLEQNHSKIAGIVIAVGAGITIVMNLLIGLAGKIWK